MDRIRICFASLQKVFLRSAHVLFVEVHYCMFLVIASHAGITGQHVDQGIVLGYNSQHGSCTELGFALLLLGQTRNIPVMNSEL